MMETLPGRQTDQTGDEGYPVYWEAIRMVEVVLRV